jgi:hypothetical protein
MRRNFVISFVMLSAFLIAALLGGCGSGNKEGGLVAPTTDLASAIHLGDLNCLQCHNSGKDLTMNNDLDTRTIGVVWQDSLHFGDLNGIQTVHCEDCHGGGQFHWGIGPIANPVPLANVCLQCHGENNSAKAPIDGLTDMQSYLATAHANGNNVPNASFSQFTPPTVSGSPVSFGQHIQECSVCHDSNQRFVYDNLGNLLKPDPASLPMPQVSCASCHDAHQVGLTANVPPRVDGSTSVDYQIFRKVQVNANGANDANAGTWIRPILFWNNSTMATQVASDGNPVDANGKRETTIENLCASCHTQGTYQFSGTVTHQTNTFGQWQNSGHGTRSDPAWAEFSANPPAYTNPNTGLPYPVGTHFTLYPYDMSLSSNKDFACKKCHHGVGSIDYQNNVQGTAAASVLWGDEPATCITCHDPHANGATTTSNIRVPVAMTQYSTSSVKIFGNVFLDTTPLPPNDRTQAITGNGVICIFCHQGRESGFTLYKTKLAPGKNPAGSFFNPHYLGTAAMLWSVNAYEFAGQSYSANIAHQGANCPTCHMANPTADNLIGGHSWNPNVATCNTSSCHAAAALGPVAPQTGTASPDVDTYRAAFDTNDYDGDGTLEPIAVEIQNLQTKLINLLAANGIFYNDLIYPYFFSDPTFTTAFTAWNRAPDGPTAYKAAFNLQFIIKGLPSAATSQTLVPNASAAVHDYKYNIQLLRDSYNNYNAVAPVPGPVLGGVRPAGTRPATVYGPGQ